MNLLNHKDDRKSKFRESTAMENGRRPGRSDARLSIEEEREMEAKTREYFNGVAPKRHTKPQRSEFSAHYLDKVTEDDYIPELAEFQRLESDPHERLSYDGRNGKISEEFVETKYYDDLNCVDKQHHTTGTGFIKMENGDCKSFRLAADSTTADCCLALVGVIRRRTTGFRPVIIWYIVLLGLENQTGVIISEEEKATYCCQFSRR